ncbi:hypothetical protein NIES4074_10390 [Cylindrospermum sp. NIES-4074]|nr:hypothetical protein NIES4074_10390 [Cylindrospermum sp. NIES-4074]
MGLLISKCSQAKSKWTDQFALEIAGFCLANWGSLKEMR